MKWRSLLRLGILSGSLALITNTAAADDPLAPGAPGISTSTEATPSTEVTAGNAEVHAALAPVAQAIAQASSSRAAGQLVTRSMIDGRVIASDTTSFQVVSKRPNLYRVHLKGDQTVQVVSDGELASVLLDAKAYYQVEAPETLQDVVTALPVPLGPYPEPLMALSLAGVDANLSLLADMKSLEVVDRDPYDGTAAVQLRGVQADDVTWVLWLATDEAKPRPLRMKVDLTAVLASDGEAALPENFAFELDFKFTHWRMDGELKKSIFDFNPPADAQRYESLEDYAQNQAAEVAAHALVGSPAPEITTETLDGTAWELSQQRGKVVVLDFWATWCGPCVEAMPVISDVVDSFAARDVVLHAVNIGQSPEQIKEFLDRLEIQVPVLLDPQGKIADAYAAEAIPQTVLIGKDGRVEAVHVGFAGLEALKQELTDQLEVLATGGKLAVAEED